MPKISIFIFLLELQIATFNQEGPVAVGSLMESLRFLDSSLNSHI